MIIIKLCLLFIVNHNFGYSFVSTLHQNHNRLDNQVSRLKIDEIKLDSKTLHENRKRDWINRSVDYYLRVMREKTYMSSSLSNEERIEFLLSEETQQKAEIATKLYLARSKIKDGAPNHAEIIYRKIIDDIMSNVETDEDCDHSALAISTLLLTLLLQRMGNINGTREVFRNFFRVIRTSEIQEEGECACSAKVLQAFALFEMKRGNSIKSFELVNKAITMDKSLEGILNWKQFRDAGDKHSCIHKNYHWSEVKKDLKGQNKNVETLCRI